mgnify:CR=1 FL=1
MKSKTALRILGVTLCLLAIPAIGMLFSDDVSWGPEDFLVAGGLIFGLGVLIAFARQRISKKRRRIVVIAFGILVFLLLWGELAVGIFGSPIAGN